MVTRGPDVISNASANKIPTQAMNPSKGRREEIVTESSQHSESKFGDVLVAAARLPGVRIDRTSFLTAALSRSCTEDQVRRAIATSPAHAGISRHLIHNGANGSIRWETTKAATLSGATGLPGGFTLIAAVPVDLAQYLAHILRVSQKLAYLYGWPSLFDDDEKMDDGTRSLLTLFVGVMFGVQSANSGVAKVSEMIAQQIVKKLPQQALTKGAIYPIVKKVATNLGIQMTKQTFARGVAKVVPVLGGVVSATVTVATFRPMAGKLRTHFAQLPLASPEPDDAGPMDAAS